MILFPFLISIFARVLNDADTGSDGVADGGAQGIGGNIGPFNFAAMVAKDGRASSDGAFYHTRGEVGDETIRRRAHAGGGVADALCFGYRFSLVPLPLPRAATAGLPTYGGISYHA